MKCRQIYTYAVHLGHVQWLIFYVPTPIPWHGTSVFKVSSEWPVTFLLLLNVKRRKNHYLIFCLRCDRRRLKLVTYSFLALVHFFDEITLDMVSIGPLDKFPTKTPNIFPGEILKIAVTFSKFPVPYSPWCILLMTLDMVSIGFLDKFSAKKKHFSNSALKILGEIPWGKSWDCFGWKLI